MSSTTHLPADRQSPLVGKLRWLDSGAADGATNMAVDSLLLDDARESGLTTLRIYAWSSPTLSLGRHERALGRFDRARLTEMGVSVVRRPTGGRALLHNREVTYSVTGPVGNRTLREAFSDVNDFLTSAMLRLGVRSLSEATPRGATEPPGWSACFAEPNKGELVVGGAKLIASAQWRDQGAFLQHGSILLDDDQSLIADLSNEESRPTLAATLSQVLGRDIPYAEVRDVLVEEWSSRGSNGVTFPLQTESIQLDDSALQRHRQTYLDPEWTWRR